MPEHPDLQGTLKELLEKCLVQEFQYRPSAIELKQSLDQILGFPNPKSFS